MHIYDIMTISDIREIFRRLGPACRNKSETSGGLNVGDLRRAVVAFSVHVGAPMDAATAESLLRSDLIQFILSHNIVDNPDVASAIGAGGPIAIVAPAGAVAAGAKGRKSPPLKLALDAGADAVAVDVPAPKMRVPVKPKIVLAPSAVKVPAKVPIKAPLRPPQPVRKEIPVVGIGRPLRPDAKANLILEPRGFESLIVDHGGGGHCGYLSVAAAIKQIPGMEDIDYKQLREIIANHIEYAEDDEVQQLALQENLGAIKVTKVTEHDAKGKKVQRTERTHVLNPNVDVNRAALAKKVRGTRWATEFDMAIFSHIYNVGIIVFRQGEIYPIGVSVTGRPYYIVLVNDNNVHYQTLGLRPKGTEEPYRYLFSCHDLPEPLKDLVSVAYKEAFHC